MNRRLLPSFFFNESDADEDLMAEKDAEKAKTELNHDALYEAIWVFDKLMTAPDGHEEAIAAAIAAYLAAMEKKVSEEVAS